MIRKSNATLWGNWTLNPLVRPGAVGYIESNSGAFVHVDNMPNITIKSFASPENWSIESSSVHRTQSDVSFKGGYKDPSTGTTVTTGLNVDYAFSKEKSIVSNGTLTGRGTVEDFGTAMKANYDWLLQKATSVGFAQNGGIIQGFGMIVMTQTCCGGVNIGSLTSSSTFSITGSVEGVNSLIGAGNVDAGVKGSYKETNETKAFESHLWPSEADAIAHEDVGIAFQFASFDNKLIMPNWVMPLMGFAVHFDNAHSGTYRAHCKVEWSEPSATGAKSKDVTVGAGHQNTIDGIPLSATSITVTVDFVHGDKFHFSWNNPLTTWIDGWQTIDMSGVWPWGAHAKVRGKG